MTRSSRTAFNMLPTRFEDGRHDAIAAGLRAAGFTMVSAPPPKGRETMSGDLAVAWNAYGQSGAVAENFIKRGASALICEEGYIRKIGGETYFAMGLNGHNGSGLWRIGGPERWDGWGFEIKPWREDGRHILVCGQRGFGYNKMAMPDDWQDTVAAQLRGLTDRPLHFRAHPKRRRRMPKARYDEILDYEQPLEDQLKDAWGCVVWTSACNVSALLEGIPTFFCGPHIINEIACHRGVSMIEAPALHGQRYFSLTGMAWAQWSMAELKSGEAFRWLLPIA